ncbi:alpha/beta fold hydrolase [Paraburkholderia sediminicola]|uniref:alpha/beta fold hydrolase n=1 Tax=Paraburkholderia sediminicola TaxID=458836 RepID=UPI0038BC3516
MRIETGDFATNGIELRADIAGSGMPVLLCHGFPESRHSWRHQVPALAEAGYRVIAPDMRGYGGSSAPESIEDFTILHLVGDMVGLLDTLGHPKAVIVGHDWGALVAWAAAMLRPDRFIGVAGLSVPFIPRTAAAPLATLRRRGRERFYWVWFEPRARAEAELDADPAESLRRMYWGLSGAAPDPLWNGMVAESGFLATFPAPSGLPDWLTPEDLRLQTAAFSRGFRAPLDWYRNLDRNWALLGAFAGTRITQPAMFLAGERDPVLNWRRDAYAAHSENLPGLVSSTLLPGIGHWIQQEAPEAVTAALLDFLRTFKASDWQAMGSR